MTIEEAIEDFEKEFPDHSWSIYKHAFFHGKHIPGKMHVMARHPLSSGASTMNYHGYADDIPQAFLNLKTRIQNGEMNIAVF